MAVDKGDFKLLEDFITLSCEFSMDLQDERYTISREIAEQMYQRFREMPERTITEFRDNFIEVISEFPVPPEVVFDREKELQRLKTVLVDLKESFYNSLVEEKYILKYLFAWIDGINLIYEIFQVIKNYLNPPRFRKRRLQQQYDPMKLANMILYVNIVMFRIYETQRKIEEGLIQTNKSINKYLKLFADEVTELSKFAITNDFIPKISSKDEQLFKDNAELMHHVFRVVNNR
ncbi:MAG: hypothetical protein HWN66_00780 [Candidatus Helarchaeota archaeon]|nr:hypothetical protein [Candidatus Helarchaeota archaeon]